MTTPRYHRHCVVTGHGAVDLRDLSDAERVEAIASTADLEFRPRRLEKARLLVAKLRGPRRA